MKLRRHDARDRRIPERFGKARGGRSRDPAIRAWGVNPKAGLLKDLSFTLNVDNLFEQAPPRFLRTGTNQNGHANGFSIGRMFMIGIAKAF